MQQVNYKNVLVAQLVEYNFAKIMVKGSNPFSPERERACNSTG